MKELYRDFKKRYIIATLADAGFAIEGPNRYTRSVGGVAQELHAYARGNKKGDPSWSFTFDLGVGYPSLGDESGASTTFACRFGYLKAGLDSWYMLDEHNQQQLGELVRLELIRYALPLFDWANTAERIALLRKLKEESSGELPAKLRELHPELGRDFVEEYHQLWRETVTPIMVAAGFAERDGALYRTVGGELTQAFGFRHWMTDKRTFLNLEGQLAFHVATPRSPTPPPLVQPPDWFSVSSSYVITEQSRHFERYQLAKQTPAQLAELLKSDLENHLLPFFARNATARALASTQEAIDAYLKTRRV